MARGRYEIKQNENGEFFFVLVTAFGKPVAHSGLYKNLVLCKKGIASLRVNSDAPLDDTTDTLREYLENNVQIKCPKIELTKTDALSGYNFFVKAKNGNVIASGEGFGTKIKCLEAIENLRYIAFSAESTLLC